MRKQGYEVKQGKQISFRAAEQNRFTRMKTLGAEYTEIAVAEKIKLQQSQSNSIKKSITSFIDIEQKKKDGKGAAYEQWDKAVVFLLINFDIVAVIPLLLATFFDWLFQKIPLLFRAFFY